MAGEIAVIDGGAYEKSKTLDVCPATVTSTGTLASLPAGSVTTIAVCDHEVTAAAGSTCPANVTVPLVPVSAVDRDRHATRRRPRGRRDRRDRRRSVEKSKTLDVCPATVTPTGRRLPAGRFRDHDRRLRPRSHGRGGEYLSGERERATCTKVVASIVTGTPPAVGPVAGEIAVIDGGSDEKNKTLDVCGPTVTPTGTLAPLPAGSVTTIAVCDHEVTSAAGSACPANVTVPLSEVGPSIVTGTPPAVGPVAGEIATIVGGEERPGPRVRRG